MILPDDTPASPTKSRAGPLSPASEDTHEDNVPPPPAYPGPPPTQQQNVDIEAQAGNSRTPLVQRSGFGESSPIEEVEPAATRFLKAFGIVVLIYLVVGSFTRTAIAGVHWDHRSGGHVEVSVRSSDHASKIPYPRQSDGKIISCSSADVGQPRFRSGPVTSFLFPLSADLLYIYGRGALSHGSIVFVPTTDRSIPEGNIRVDITPHFENSFALGSANICLLEPAVGQRSIAILTPRQWWPSSDLEFKVEVRFPAQATPLGKPLRVKAFETNLPLFEHAFSELEGKVSFGSLKVSSTNMPIHAWVRWHSVEADNATMVTSNARIDGKFRVSRELELRTSNQAIDAQVTLDHDVSRSDTVSSNLTMVTTNARIDSKISLRRAAYVQTGGSFSVSAHTSNGAVDLAVTSQPADSTLTLSARASNSPATVHLNPAFEGAIEIGTTNGPVSFDVNKKASDPGNRGRQRMWVVSEKTMKMWKGFVSWGSPHGRRLNGRVTVQTENGAAELQV
ncbi:hypothetical protein DICSQDRAFT_62362 [Dichomitus squalens LYAD-421 SS1]|uniref:DUF7330 domain-containing protein n=1 Tax=Dichomitus squalens (strain LYAD-421) TaxID=732165 RepID=R7T0H7_DICSQ|nr:uncharacterized protein DICSQDRAFT_62362 [Dichomitus squalens LYAD-421 SS1]EJF60662.1 hypothetical protein DICSQDRAFT_62362 [Dichomitus squalens LYAD-421 SS1]